MPIKMKFKIGSLDITKNIWYKRMYGQYDKKEVDVYGFYHYVDSSICGNGNNYAYVRFPGRNRLDFVSLDNLTFIN